jgi:segregation and condensation protein B
MHRKPKLTRRVSAGLVGRPHLRIWTPPLAMLPRRPRRPRRPPTRRRLNRAAEPTTPGDHRRCDDLARLEAALFVSRQPLSTRRLAKLARLPDGTKARALLRELRRLQDESGAAFRVEQIAGGFQLLTRGALGPWVRRILTTPPENRLSTAALETLAIVAYRQPVTRAEIEAIRGVGCEEMLRQLLDRDFVAVGGRREDLGRPHFYQTTNRFLQAFGLSRIEDLPRLESAGPSDAVSAGEIPSAPPG